MLAGGLSVTVRGPAALAVADAEVDEAEGAKLEFAVSLSRSRDTEATVEYATSDGTATAGLDYTATSGRLSFAAGEMSKIVAVTVLDDGHDEGSETMVLTLSNPSGAVLGDASAIGTINNTDAMPKAWMVRFGRTVGSQVVDALTRRLDGAGASHVTVAGIPITGGAGIEPEIEEDDPFGLPEWATSAEREADAQTITADDILLRSAFHLSSGGDGTHAEPALTAWGRVATGRFETEENNVTMDGDVTTGLIGFDAEWERALAGMMIAQSSGEGSYELDAEKGDDAGTVESSLTGVYPYARIDLNAKVSAWALAGMGSGELTLHQKDGKSMPTDISLRMGAVGVKGQVLDGTGPSKVAMNVKSDAMWVGTKSEDTDELAPTEGDVTRIRLILEGNRAFELGNGATFTPSAELGLPPRWRRRRNRHRRRSGRRASLQRRGAHRRGAGPGPGRARGQRVPGVGCERGHPRDAERVRARTHAVHRSAMGANGKRHGTALVDARRDRARKRLGVRGHRPARDGRRLRVRARRPARRAHPLCGHDARRWRQPHGAKRRPLAAESRCGVRARGDPAEQWRRGAGQRGEAARGAALLNASRETR